MAKGKDRIYTIIDTMYSELDNARFSLFGDTYKPNDSAQLSYNDKLIKIQQGYNRLYNFAEKKLKENQQLKNEIEQLRLNPPKPKSNAGRCSKFNNEQKEKIRFMQHNLSIREIAEQMNCSTGLVHKIIHEHDIPKK